MNTLISKIKFLFEELKEEIPSEYTKEILKKKYFQYLLTNHPDKNSDASNEKLITVISVYKLWLNLSTN